MINNKQLQKRAILSPKRMTLRSRRLTYCRGQTLVEYALILAFISIVAIGVLLNLSHNVGSLYTTIDSQIQRAPGGVNAGP